MKYSNYVITHFFVIFKKKINLTKSKKSTFLSKSILDVIMNCNYENYNP